MSESKPERAYNNACGHAYNDSAGAHPCPVCDTGDYLRGGPDKIRDAQAKRIVELGGKVALLRAKVVAGERLAQLAFEIGRNGADTGRVDRLWAEAEAFCALPTPGEKGESNE